VVLNFLLKETHMRLTLIIRSFIAAGLLVAAAGRLQPAAAAPGTASFIVASTQDVVDDNPGDGVCHTLVSSPAGGRCTLRAAVMEADATNGLDVSISVPAGVYPLLISADVTNTANTGDLNLTTPTGNPTITLTGAGAGRQQRHRLGRSRSGLRGRVQYPHPHRPARPAARGGRALRRGRVRVLAAGRVSAADAEVEAAPGLRHP